MTSGKRNLEAAGRNRLALLVVAIAAVLTIVILSLPVMTFTTAVYTKRSANTFVGDEKYIGARAEAEAAAQQYARWRSPRM